MQRLCPIMNKRNNGALTLYYVVMIEEDIYLKRGKFHKNKRGCIGSKNVHNCEEKVCL